MILTKEKIDEFLEASKPLMKWLAENCHPHTAAIVENDRAELIEGIAIVKCNSFIKD